MAVAIEDIKGATTRIPGAASQWRKQLSDFGTSDISPSNEVLKYSAADAAKMMAEFDVELEKATSRDPAVRGDITKSIAPQFAGLLSAGQGFGGSGDTIAQVVKALQALSPDLAKDITITSPLSTGFVPYDLQAPSKKVFPALTPLRNRIPRTQGQGTAARFKRVDGITGSGTGGVGLNSPFISEFSTTSTWGSSTLVRPPKISYAASDATFNYKFLGASDAVTFGAEWTSRGFESLRALSSFSLMKAMMLMEENAIVGGRITAIAAPAAPTGLSRAPQTGESAITGFTTSLWFKVTSVGQFGESTLSVASAAVAIAATQVCDVTVTDVQNALGYRLYVSTGVADPGDAARWRAATFAANIFTLQGALPTSGTAASTITADGTASANAYDGLFTQIDANGGIAGKRLNAAPSPTMFDTDLGTVWQNFKADPDEILLNGIDRLNLSNATINLASQNQAYRIMLGPEDQANVLAGGMVSTYVNKVTGKIMKFTVHPWFAQGSALLASWALPFPWSEVPNTVEVRNVQDYLQIDWPVIQMSYDLSILLLGAVVVYAPIYFLSYHGIAQTYNATTGAKYS